MYIFNKDSPWGNFLRTVLKTKKNKRNRGMTYIEIIVVLSIFSMLSGVAIYNYGDFQAKVDIKNLASDIALKVVEAQKSSLAGNLPPTGAPSGTWKPSYGVYFGVAPQTQFIYFVDLNNDKIYNETPLDIVNITKGNSISRIDIYTGTTLTQQITNPISITFRRPDSGASFTGVSPTGSEYVQITIKSPKDTKSYIKLYPSGRVQVN